VSVDDDDPRHSLVARQLQHDYEQKWTACRERTARLVADNDQLRLLVKAAISTLVESVGKCEHCGQRAPLMRGAKLPSHRLRNVCVYGWGCSAQKKEKP
jgi:hypothetical protein